MTPEQHIDHLAADSARFASATAGTHDRDIAFLDDWSIRDLVAHLGGVYAYVVANTAGPASELARPGAEARAPEGDEINDWFAERRTVLLETLAMHGDETPAASHAGLQNVAWWKRRMAAETAVHLWDASAAIHGVETAEEIDGDLALDCIDEYIEVTLRAGRSGVVYPSASLHLHRTDGPGEWMLVADGEGGVAMTHEHGKGDAAVRGSASDLLMWMWGRPATDIQIFGDETVAATWHKLGK